VTHYRCYLIVGERIRASEDIDAPNDASALLEAEKLILESDALVIEVWQEKRFVGRWTVGPDINVIRGGKS
jgi:hypothetical protein